MLDSTKAVQTPHMTGACSLSEGLSPWLIKDPTIYHPEIWPNAQGGASLQDVRHYYLSIHSDDSLSNSTVTVEPWYIQTPDPAWHPSLCEYCRHIDFRWLARHRTQQNRGPILWLREMLRNRATCRFCNLAIKGLCINEGKSISPDELELEDQVICCWIISENYTKNCYDGKSFQLGRRVLAVTGGWIGEVVSIQEIGSGDDRSPGRILQPSGADLSLVKKWIDTCESKHEEEANAPVQTHHIDSKLQLRLVDVNKLCIVKADSTARYVALSYVWGRVTQLRLLLENEAELSTTGALTSQVLEIQCTRTILDAIDFVRLIGEQYLWVDALCLVQDGPDFAAQVQNMEDVYTGAAWTLVAGSATDANCRLDRSTPADKNTTYQHISHIRGRNFAVVLPSLQVFLASSPWNRRAWTYQESVLSDKLIYVTDKQVYFSCRHGYTFCEDTKFEDNPPLADERLGHVFGTASTDTNFKTYTGAVEEYTSRQISFHEDALNAVTGVLTFLRDSFRSDFLFGLPLTELDQALLWYPHPKLSTLTRRKDSNGKPLFPSWSWLGWVGGCQYRAGLVLGRVEWRTPGSSESAFVTSERLRAPSNLSHEHDWREDGWREHSLEEGLENPSSAYYWDYDSCWHEQDNTSRLYVHPIAPSNKAGELLSIMVETGLLEFQALVCRLKITGAHASAYARFGLPCSEGKHELCSLSIYNQDDIMCGTVHVPGSIATSLGPGSYDFVRLSRSHLASDTVSYHRFPVDWDEWDHPDTQTVGESLLERGYADDDVVELENEIGPEDAFEFDEARFWIDSPWCVYNVMMIEVKEAISYRIGIGKVHIDAFYGEEYLEWRKIKLG